jgi:hypothetical protein
VWAVGSYTGAKKTMWPLVEHWNGSAWSVAVPPRHGVSSVANAVAAVTASDLLVVGSYNDATKIAWPLTERYSP